MGGGVWLMCSQTGVPLMCCCDVSVLQDSKKFEGSQPEWCISSKIYSRDTPFWSETLDVFCLQH